MTAIKWGEPLALNLHQKSRTDMKTDYYYVRHNWIESQIIFWHPGLIYATAGLERVSVSGSNPPGSYQGGSEGILTENVRLGSLGKPCPGTLESTSGLCHLCPVSSVVPMLES